MGIIAHIDFSSCKQTWSGVGRVVNRVRKWNLFSARWGARSQSVWHRAVG